MTTTINWDDGTSDKIYITYNAAEGNQSLQVSSDPNNGSTNRTKIITFKTTIGGTITKTLTITQESGMSEVTVNLTPASFVSGQYASISGQTNPIGKDETSTSYATINLRTGNAAETWAFWKFDCSAIPADATIVSIGCSAKAMTQQVGGNRVTKYQIQLYKGTTTAKGSSTNLTTSASILNLSCGNWTRSELDDINIRLYAQRGKNSTTTTYYLRFYGAQLTIKYLTNK